MFSSGVIYFPEVSSATVQLHNTQKMIERLP